MGTDVAKQSRIALGFLVGIAIVSIGRAFAEPNTVTCALNRAGTEFAGTCEIPCLVYAMAISFDGPSPGVTCAGPPHRVTSTLRRIPTSESWLGTMEGKFPEDPTRFEVISGRGSKPGVAKTPYGWFRLDAARLADDRLTIDIQSNALLPPTIDDVRIIQRAIALLPDAKVWNKNDDRNCPPNPQKLSVFCALMQATQEVAGGVHYRQPALQVVREIVNIVGGTRVKTHRLMEYNNHPDTTLDDIHTMLRMAQTRLEQRLR